MSPVEKPLAVPGFLPAVPSDRLLTEVSTGEAKRILLHALLTRATEVTVLDEPYEHLSSAAKQALTHVLLERARNSIVVVATNQDIPEQGNVPQVFRLPGGGAGEGISRLSVEA
jgi:ABC-type Mn2+/Zn2+ transport system ATPase subunit